MSMSPRATMLPLRHLSVRVPWHDAGWDGTVCRHPVGNASCLILKRIREQRNDDRELARAGQSWLEMDGDDRPPCVAENVGFLLDREHVRRLRHAYTNFSPAHANLLPTPLRLPPFSVGAIPFRWMRRENMGRYVEQAGVVVDDELEKQADRLVSFPSGWVQDGRNQRALLDAFFSAVAPKESLVFFYAKQTPLAEDPRRVIIGVGRVASIGPPQQYEANGANQLQTMVWERVIGHSIQPKYEDGFLLPYHELLKAAAKDPSLDLSQFVAFAPDEAFDAFSYGAEHVEHDQAIAALLSCAEGLRRAATVVKGDWETQLAWIDTELNRLWRLRGPCPGLGSALTVYGIAGGTFLAHELSRTLHDNEDPWPNVERLFADTSLLGPEWQRRLDPTLAAMWSTLPEERRSLLKLLSRFNITAKQAERFYQENERKNAGIDASDAELLANPYRIFELDRVSADAVTVQTIDRGVFPDPVVSNAHPLPPPSAIDLGADRRRIRAFVVHVLEIAAQRGDTLQDRDAIIAAVDKLNLQPVCPVSYDVLAYVDDFFAGEVSRVPMKDGSPAYQLDRLTEMGGLIRRWVETRLSGKRHTVTADWPQLVEECLSRQGVQDEADPEPGTEANHPGKREQIAALAEIAASRVSVLIGPAGTGKTTLLCALASAPEIARAGVLLLAPTGKARVQLESKTELRAQTLAQFLVKRRQYRWQTGAYTLPAPDRPPEKFASTVIIDEASMLTEEQLAATLSALSGVERLILVGDPRQLPPIGAGRPFVDIVNRLRPDGIDARFPRVGTGYAELTINYRHRSIGEERNDVLLAEWFGGQSPDPGADQVWERIAAAESSKTLDFVRWTNDADLQDKLIDTIVAELKLAGRSDEDGFERSIGGAEFLGKIYFHAARDGNDGAASHAERWQILSPVNNRGFGVDDLNRSVQRQFRRTTLANEPPREYWRLPEPFGREQIVYGDKVINVENKRRKFAFPKQREYGYVANGEIGVVVGQYKGQNARYEGRPWMLEVEFSTQPGSKFGYFKWDFNEERSSLLELAYALTIHKAQGSEFGITFLVLPDPLPMLSRELLYTALTRQRERVVILHQGDLTDLRRFASPIHSETGRRLTNLFVPPEIVEIDGKPLEANLIHRTRRGEAVRSKSEVIIADQLFARNLEYTYEPRFSGADGSVRFPDFVIDDPASGQKVYWEHLGLLHDPRYRARWERKLAWYRSQGIVPWGEEAGEAGVLVTTRDDPAGGIDSGEIARKIEDVFGP